MASSGEDTNQPDGSAAAPPSFVVHEPAGQENMDQPSAKQQQFFSSSSSSFPTTGRRRPISTIAQSFATDLDSMFGLGPGLSGVDQLSLTVEEKKKTVSSSQSELEALEARLRATEQRMAKISRQSSPARPPVQEYHDQSQGHPAVIQLPPARAAPTVPVVSGQEQVQQGQPGQQGQQGRGREDYVMVDRGGAR